MPNFISLHQPAGLKTAWMPGQNTYLDTFSRNPMLRQFKLFIPPGVTRCGLSQHVGQGQGLSYNYVARLGSPPQNAPKPEQPIEGHTLAELAAGDCYGSNSQGMCL